MKVKFFYFIPLLFCCCKISFHASTPAPGFNIEPTTKSIVLIDGGITSTPGIAIKKKREGVVKEVKNQYLVTLSSVLEKELHLTILADTTLTAEEKNKLLQLDSVASTTIRNNYKASIILILRDCNSGFRQGDVRKVPGFDGTSTSKVADYAVFFDTDWIILQGNKVFEKTIVASKFHSTRSISSGLLARGPGFAANKKDILDMAEQNAFNVAQLFKYYKVIKNSVLLLTITTGNALVDTFNFCIFIQQRISKLYNIIMEIIKDKVVYITGGSKGIGYGIAKILLDKGMKVAITSRSLKAAQDAATTLSKDESRVFACESNVSSMASEQKVVQSIIDHFGKLDVLVANAGVGHFAPIETLTEEDWKDTIDTNLTGVFNSVKAVIEPLKKNKGYIITIASLAGANFFENGAAYNASKFGLVGFSQAIMLDLRKHGIKVSTIMPGSVATHFNNHIPNADDAWKIQPEDIGQLVAGLLEMNPRTLPSKIEVRPSIPAKG